jgi:hypothetical protein
MRRCALSLPVLMALAFAAGCSDESDQGSPPSISDLTYAPTTVTVGQLTTITGTFSFTDPDGDLKEMTASLTPPAGQPQTLPAQALQNEAGQTSGMAQLQLVLQPPLAGTYSFEVWLTDDAGNDSNHLTGTFEAQ